MTVEVVVGGVHVPAVSKGKDVAAVALPMIDDRDERIARLQADSTMSIDSVDHWQAVVPFAERQALYATARTYLLDNSVAAMQTSLVFDWKRGDWIRFTTIAESVETDNALLFMRLVAGQWTVENFGTAFPDMYEEFPELLGE